MTTMASYPLLLSAASTFHRHLILKRQLINALYVTHAFSTLSTSNKQGQRPRPPRSKLKNNDDSSPSNNNETKIPSLTKSKTNWREWFQSADYDDPWSSHYSFQNSIPEATNATNSGTATSSSPWNTRGSHQGNDSILKNVENGSWRRRRHGRNLEPLVMQIASVDQNDNAADYDIAATATATATATEDNDEDKPQTTNNNKDNNNNNTETHKMIINDKNKNDNLAVESIANESAEATKAKARLKWLDGQTRFLCRMLDDLYRTGIRRQIDRPRTERCHRMIGKLLSMSPKPLPDKGEGFQPSITFSGLAPRANSILERMELCSPIELEINRLKSNTNIMDKVDDDDNTSTAFPQSSLPPVGSYQGIYAQFPHHLTTIKHTLPAPTRKIYTMVLLLYAKESGPIHVAQQAEDVVWSMVLRANQQPRPLPEKDNGDEFKLENLNPSMEHWNCVLQCWSMSKDPDRGFHAYSFLRSWVQWNNLCENNTNSLEIHSPTIESYQSVLRACLWNTTSNGNVEELRAREIGSGVAIRLWKDVEGLSNSSSSGSSLWSSSSYALLLRAICQTSELPSTSSTRPAVTSFARVFRRCCKDGMMTHEILQLARDATTDSQFSQLVGKDVKLVDDEGHFVSVEEIANRVPFEWMKNSAL